MGSRGGSVDKGYAWVVVFASFLAHTIQYGITWTVGVFFDIFRVEFEGSNGALALISSLNTCIFYMAGPVSSLLTNRFGYRIVVVCGGLLGSLGLILSMFATNIWHLYITYSFITGVGFGMSYIPTITILGPYFEKRRTIALGLAVSGTGFGTFVFPPLIRLFVEQYGWRGGLLLTGGVCLNICVCGALMRPPPQPKQSPESTGIKSSKLSKSQELQKHAEKKSLLNLAIFKNFDYLMLCLSNALYSFGLSVVYIHLGAYGETLGCTKNQGAMLISTIGISNFLGRFVYGFLAHTKCARALTWYVKGFLFCGVTTLFTPLARGYAGLIVCAACFGLFSANVGPLLPQIQVDFLGVAMLTSSYGYLLVFCAIGTLLGAPVAGWVYDWTEYYPFSLYLGGATLVLTVVVMLPSWFRTRTGNTHREIILDERVETEVSPTDVKYEKALYETHF